MRYGGDGDPFSKRTKNKIFDRQDGKCHDQLGCGKPLGDDTEYHHTVAKSWGGSNDPWNGVALHHDCHDKITKNQKKSGYFS